MARIKASSNLLGVYVKVDPLSPFLFIVMEEVLSKLLKQQFERGKIGRFSHPRIVPIISHLLYMNDLLILSIRMLIKTLESYENWSNQIISKKKSTFYPSKKITIEKKREGLFNFLIL